MRCYLVAVKELDAVLSLAFLWGVCVGDLLNVLWIRQRFLASITIQNVEQAQPVQLYYSLQSYPDSTIQNLKSLMTLTEKGMGVG